MSRAFGARFAVVVSLALAGLVGCSPPVVTPEGGCGGVECDAHASCQQSGTPRCVCAPGWTGDGAHCADEDECATGTAACDANASCHNTPGGYECACAAGFDGDGTSCADIDECTGTGLGKTSCGLHGQCENLPGDFACACDDGWIADGHACVDLNECDTPGRCGEREACVNLPGTFACVCADGWHKQGGTCVDVDECATATPCDFHASCTNTEGSFTCACASGFTGDGRTCTDIDECAAATSPCPGTTCENTPGSYVCRCPAGLSWNAAHAACEDADECALGTATCGAHEACVNTPGAWRCDCAAGWQRQGIVCVDVDECATGGGGCGANASCVNLPGSYRCACNAGFTEVNGACADVDECASGNPCGSLGTCRNTAGSYACTCAAGAIRDAGTCRPAFPGHLAATYSSACDLRADGSVWCWGSGESAGLGSTQWHSIPAQMAAPAAWRTISMGNSGSGAGVAADGTLWQWGLGKGPNGTSATSPVRVSVETDWFSVTSGGDASCAIKRDGSLWCWGPNRSGAVGDGSTTTRNTPVRIGAGTDWTRVSAGPSMTCGLHSGAISCWGAGGFGTGQTQNSSAVPVAGPPGTDWVELNLGYANCGIRGDGSLWCWGYAVPYTSGSLYAPTPVRIGNETGWTQVASSSGQASVCALRGGAVWCIGANQLGQLGVGDNLARATLTQVAGPADYTEIASGGVFACGRHESGLVSCWGETLYGRLGNGLGLGHPPSRVGTDTWKSAKGQNYTTCALRSDNVLACTGQFGDIAHGTHAMSPTPVGSFSDWTDFSVGQIHVCGLHANGQLSCWGGDTFGQCGVPSPGAIGYVTPSYVGAASDVWTSVSAGGEHTCATKSDGSGWCWGSNTQGQLGRVLQGSTSTPQRVGTGTWRSLAAGGSTSCGIDGSGALWCWGSNQTWQLASPQPGSVSAPQRIGTDTDWYMAAVSFSHACALKTSGALYCWGSRYAGATPSGADVPVRIGNDLFTSVAAAYQGMSAIRTDGRTFGGTPPTLSPFSIGLPALVAAKTPIYLFSATCGIQTTDGSLWCSGTEEFGELGFGTAWSTVPVAQITGP